MAKRVSMQNIADELGISKVSVSKALNHQEGISDALREKILETAKKLGHRAPTGTRRKFTFAFAVPKRYFLETDRFYNIIYYHLNKKLLSDGHRLLLVVMSEEEESSGELPLGLDQQKVDGIFLVGQMGEAVLHRLCACGVPTVAVDFYSFGLETDFVLADNFFLGYRGAMELLRRGHREIGFVGDIHSTSSIADRYFGYLKAMTLEGLSVRPEWVICNNDAHGVYTAEVALPDRLPTGFVCHCEMAAYFLKMTLEGRGLSVPEDVSVIAFDDTDIGRTAMQNLTTFNIGRREIAESALQLMLGRLCGTGGDYGRHYVHSRLIERDSIRMLTV